MNTLALSGIFAAHTNPEGRRPQMEWRQLSSAVDLGYVQKIWIGGDQKYRYTLTKSGEQAFEMAKQLAGEGHEFDAQAKLINAFERDCAPTVPTPKRKTRVPKNAKRRHMDNIRIVLGHDDESDDFITARLKSRTRDGKDHEHWPRLYRSGTFSCTCEAWDFKKNRCWAIDRLVEHANKHGVFADAKPVASASTLKETFNLSTGGSL